MASASASASASGENAPAPEPATSASCPRPLPMAMDSPYGLFLVAEPPAGQKVSIDIIAVPGINGDPIKSWTSPKTGVFWLRDLLTTHFPDARILTYGWNSMAGNFGSGPALKEVAITLLNHMTTYRQSLVERQRPIIFIAHSVGGLVVKRAVVIASAHRRGIFSFPPECGILFFGTPHNGSSAASWGTVAAKMTRAFNVKYSVSPQLMETLKTNSVALQDLSNDFRYVSPNLELATFYETFPTTIGGANLELVDSASSKMNLPNERQFALPATHSDLCKFDSSDDQKFRIVLHVLLDFKHNLLESAKLRLQRGSQSRTSPPGVPRLASPETKIQYQLNIDIFSINRSYGFARRLLSNTTMTISEFLENGIKEILDKIDLPLPETSDDESIPNQQEVSSEEQSWIGSMTWVHIPVNNTHWVHPCLMNLAAPLDLKLSITEPQFWMLNETKGKGDLPHSRSMLPSVFFDISKSDIDGNIHLQSCKQLAIYFPYLNWDTMECFLEREKYIHKVYKRKTAHIPMGLEEKTRAIYEIIRDFLNLGASFHPRRSLDQFFYSRLPDTSSRDKDQVISKRTVGSEGGPKMIMVDQLWLWVIDSKDSKDEPIQSDDAAPRVQQLPHTSLVTFFPEKDSEGEGDTLYPLSNLKQGIVDRITNSSSRYESAWLLAAIAIKEAVNIMLEARYESLNFLEIFREAIGDTSEQQTQFFRKFRTAVERGTVRENTLKEKKEELKLVLEVADIIDELNTLTRLFDVQKDTLDEALPIFRENRRVSVSRDNIAAADLLTDCIKDVESYRIQVKRMREDAERTYNSLLSLLDLQQKEANIDEAHVAARQLVHTREQADATSAQSQILLLFTVVTIIFLPLSFFTSYFGMNVIEQTGSTGDQSLSHVWRIMGPASAVIILFCFISSVVMYLVDKRKLERQRLDEDKSLNDPESPPAITGNSINGSSSSGSSLRKRKKAKKLENEEECGLE